MDRFIPDDLIPLEQAVLALTKAKAPEIWEGAGEQELALYGRLGFSLHAEDMPAHLRALNLHSAERKGVTARWRAYADAQPGLHQALYAGRVPFEVREESSFKRIALEAEIWADASAVNWFGDGRLFLPDGGSVRKPFGPYVPGLPDELNFVDMPSGLFGVIVLPKEGFSRLLAELPIAPDTSAEQGSPVRLERLDDQTKPAQNSAARPLSERAVGETFRKWRDEQSALGRVPTHDEDVAFMREHGVSRDRVRELRRDVPRLPRGNLRRASSPGPRD